MKKYFLLIVFAGLTVALLSSCKKDAADKELKAVFSYSTSKLSVTFKNFTDFTNIKEPYATYEWDFGDGTTSTDENPFHQYKEAGEYTVTLVANKNGRSSTFSDVVTVQGGIQIDIDGDFSDWDDVEYTYQNESGESSLLGVKVFSDGSNIYLLLEGTENMDVNAMDLYFNTDGDANTGYQMSDYPAGSGAEYLFEGNIPWWGSFFQFQGTSDNFDDFDELFDLDDVDDSGIDFSEMTELDNGNFGIEISIKRSLLGNVSGSLSFAISDTDAGWNQQGALPEGGEDDSAFITVEL